MNSNNVRITKAGIYRVTYAISVEKSGGSDRNLKFQVAKGWNSNFVPGSAVYVFLGNGDKATVSQSKMMHFNANEYLYIFTDIPSSAGVQTIADGTYLSVELVKAD